MTSSRSLLELISQLSAIYVAIKFVVISDRESGQIEAID